MKSFLINLDRAPERLAFFTKQAARAGLAFERVAAVDYKAEPETIARAISPAFQFQPVGAGEAAVFLSHRRLWQKLVDSGDSHCAIFEDDAVLGKGIGPLLQAIEAAGVEGVVRLETTGRRIVVEAFGLETGCGFALHRQLTWHGGTAGYVIDRASAALLLEDSVRIADPVDQLMFHPRSRLFEKLIVRQSAPACVIQYDILHAGKAGPALASSTGRKQGRMSLFRHGMSVDLKRIWMKHAERRMRERLGALPGNLTLVVPFSGEDHA